jgi:hypothetical protein
MYSTLGHTKARTPTHTHARAHKHRQAVTHARARRSRNNVHSSSRAHVPWGTTTHRPRHRDAELTSDESGDTKQRVHNHVARCAAKLSIPYAEASTAEIAQRDAAADDATAHVHTGDRQPEHGETRASD